MKRLAIKTTLVLATLALAATLLVPAASAGKPKSGQTVSTTSTVKTTDKQFKAMDQFLRQ